MAHVFTTLERASADQGQGRLPEWLSTHPDPGDRAKKAAERAAAAEGRRGRRSGATSTSRTSSGMTFGEDPRQGFFQGNAFLHPDLKFRIDLPAGWQKANTPGAVVAVSPKKDAAIQLVGGREGLAGGGREEVLLAAGGAAGELRRGRRPPAERALLRGADGAGAARRPRRVRLARRPDARDARRLHGGAEPRRVRPRVQGDARELRAAHRSRGARRPARADRAREGPAGHDASPSSWRSSPRPRRPRWSRL